MHTHAMISTHPDVRGSVNETLVHCIDECLDCSQTCLVCADACLGEEGVRQLAQCIRLDLDCADICAATATLASRRTGSNEAVLRNMIELCAEACRVCAEECARHASHHEHCRICAETCRRCEVVCRRAAESVTPKTH
jgi:hypothetical protein